MTSTMRIAFCICLAAHGMLLQAQQGTVPTGGDAVGTNGSVSYTVGQVDYGSASGPTGVLTEGVQQPYEIVVITAVEEEEGNMDLKVYPNPTADNVVLQMDPAQVGHMSFTLYDAEGKVVFGNTLRNDRTTIRMADLSNATYFLAVYRNGAAVRSFRITKNR